MNAPTPNESRSDDPPESKSRTSGVTVTGYAVLGCLGAGTLGIFKAAMAEGTGSAACILASAAAFGIACHVCFRKG